MRPQEERALKVLHRAGRPLSIDEIADRLGISIRTARRIVSKLEDKGLVSSMTVGRKKLYKPTLRSQQLTAFLESEQYSLLEVEAIPKRIKAMTKKEVQTAYKLAKEHILNTKPEELRKELIDFLEDEIKRMANKRGEEVRRSIEKMERDKVMLASMEWIGGMRHIGHNVDTDHEIIVTGSDASDDSLYIIWHCGPIPIAIHAHVVACVGVPWEISKEGYEERGIIRQPEFPLSAGDMYFEDLSSKYPGLDESQRRTIGLINMNTAHYEFDKRLIVKEPPDIHFHDGRLLPPHMHYLDFVYEWRREPLRRCFEAAVSLKEMARRLRCELVGVVKEPHPQMQIMKKVVAMLISKNCTNVKYLELATHMEELFLLDELLSNNTVSWIIKFKPMGTYLEGQEEQAKKVLGERELYIYTRYLKDFEFCFFYAKHRDGGVARYDIYCYDDSHASLIQRRDRISIIANSLAMPLIESHYRPERRYRVSVPNVVAIADRESRGWARSVANIIAGYIRERLMGGGR